MIDMSPRVWAGATVYARPTSVSYAKGSLTPRQWLLRHGLWIFLLVVVTVWEALGFIFPVASKTPSWWDHPTISSEVKKIIGTSLPGRIISTLLLIAACITLILHWSWRLF